LTDVFIDVEKVTICVTRRSAGVDNVREQIKLEAIKTFENLTESPPTGTVRLLFTSNQIGEPGTASLVDYGSLTTRVQVFSRTSEPSWNGQELRTE
jgi:hypothetical protein